jgi:hypothetical protein
VDDEAVNRQIIYRFWQRRLTVNEAEKWACGISEQLWQKVNRS